MGKIIWENYSMENKENTRIPWQIMGVINELAYLGYIDKGTLINANFLNKIHIEELIDIDIDKIGKIVQQRMKE